MNVISKPTQRVLPDREGPTKAVILHTTGATDLAKILAFYQSKDGLQPHYSIGLDGTVYSIVDESKVAWHCAIEKDEATIYESGYKTWSEHRWVNDRVVDFGQEYTGYRQWRDQWRPAGLDSPLELVTGRHPNSVSVGIELLQPVNPGPAVFTDAQYQAAAELVSDVCARNKIVVNRQNILGHYDCSPMRRCNDAGGWDPGYSFSWNKFFDTFKCGY